MNNIELIIPNKLFTFQDNIISNLNRNGFNNIIIDEKCDLNTVSLSIALLEPKDPDVFLKVGYRLGKQIPMIIISEKTIYFPSVLKNVYFIKSKKDCLDFKLIKLVNKVLKIERPSDDSLKDFNKLTKWISDDISRLNYLDETTFEILIANIFDVLGYNIIQEKKYGREDMWCHDHKRNLKMLIQCKISQKEQPLGIDVINQVRNLSDIYDNNLSLLITNSHFTNAAKQLADKCFPAIYLLELEQLKKGISDIIEKKKSDHNQLYNLIEQKINKATNTELLINSFTNKIEFNWSDGLKSNKYFYDFCFLSSNKEKNEYDNLIGDFFIKTDNKNFKTNFINTINDKNYSEWSLTLRNSRVIIIMLNYNNYELDSYDRRLLNLLANSYDSEKNKNSKYIIFSNDKAMNRFDLPNCLKKAWIVKPQKDNFRKIFDNLIDNVDQNFYF